MEDDLIIKFDAFHGDDEATILVGRPESELHMELVNAISGKEALELYNRLVGKTKGVKVP